MSKSIFQILGPIMIGPSSSHTAGAVRLSKLGRQIAGKSFNKVLFELHGSFAHTYAGHGTDRALIAGALGFSPDDERIPNSYDYAKEKGLSYEFKTVEIGGAHPNTVRMTFYHGDEKKTVVQGSSIGGGNVIITSINDMDVHFTGDKPTIILKYYEQKGIISYISSILYEKGYNIAGMRTIKEENTVLLIVELDEGLDSGVYSKIAENKEFIFIKYLERGNI